MPLRDHFHPPVTTIASWEELHGQWPAVIVQQLRKQLPPGYVSGPRLHAGAQGEIDVAASEYEIRVHNAESGRTLVTAIEIVSPANKDRPERRNAFIGKCAALLRRGVAVSIVDVVTVRDFNLYAELMVFLGDPDQTLGPEPSAAYTASCRWVRKLDRAVLETWSHALSIGHQLPILPLWLTEESYVPLNLERSYEKACEDQSIP
jgi:hypothetical protein